MKDTLIIFDCFGVIFEDVAPPFLKKFLPEDKANEVKEKLFPPADRGDISYDTLLSDLAKALSLPRNELEEQWNRMFVLKEDTVSLIKQLKGRYTLALLSNAPEGIVEELFEKYGLTEHFDKIFVSYKHRLVKPQRKFYELCVSSFEKKFEKVYMIDDNKTNLDGLEEIGITPLLFESAEDIEKELRVES